MNNSENSLGEAAAAVSQVIDELTVKISSYIESHPDVDKSQFEANTKVFYQHAALKQIIAVLGMFDNPGVFAEPQIAMALPLVLKNLRETEAKFAEAIAVI